MSEYVSWVYLIRTVWTIKEINVFSFLSICSHCAPIPWCTGTGPSRKVWARKHQAGIRSPPILVLCPTAPLPPTLLPPIFRPQLAPKVGWRGDGWYSNGTNDLLSWKKYQNLVLFGKYSIPISILVDNDKIYNSRRYFTCGVYNLGNAVTKL